MPSSSEVARLDSLEKKEVALEAEISRLDREEKDLERRLTELELKEIELAKSVSRLTQVKARRPEFLMNYMKSAKKSAPVTEANPIPIPSPAPIPAARAPNITPAPAAAPVIAASAPLQSPQAPGPEVKSAPATASTQARLAEAPAPTPSNLKVEEKSERKQILEAQIKSVLKKQEIKRIEEQQKQDVLDAKAPVRGLKLDGKMSESADLFKLLLSKGAMTLEEASKILQADKETMFGAAKDLEDSGLIEVNRPLYGSPKIRLKSLTERIKDAMDKPPEKK